MSGGGEPLFAAFDRLRRADGGALAVLDTDGGRSLGRDDLLRLVEHCEAALRPSGAVAALRIPNSPEMIAAVLASWRSGRVPLLLDAELADAEAQALCGGLGVGGIVCGAALEWRALDSPTATAADLPRGTAVLKQTSGTTGAPRAVAVTGSALLAGLEQIASTMAIAGGDRNLVPVPLAHSYGFDNVVLTLALLGCPAILVRDLTPRRLLAVARKAEATVLPAVPFLIDVLSRAPAGAGGADRALRLVISAGAPLPLETRERFAARFGVRPRTFYGATECGGIAFDRDGDAAVPEGCVGGPLDGVALELADADDGVGRVRVRSASVAAASLTTDGDASGSRGAPPPAPDEATLAPGCFTTADLGRIDERGRLHLLGRALEVVNVGGRKVFPAEVERVIRRIPGVREVAVVGVSRSAVADALHAIVVADAGVDRDTVIRTCEAELARYKVPRALEFRAELPRTARGKLDRRRLGR